jgi:hypothetical protein
MVQFATTRDASWFLAAFGVSTAQLSQMVKGDFSENVTCDNDDDKFGFTQLSVEEVNIVWSNLALLVFYIVEGFGTFTKSVRKYLHNLQNECFKSTPDIEGRIKTMLRQTVITLKYVTKDKNQLFAIGSSRRIRSFDTYMTLHKIASDLLANE